MFDDDPTILETEKTTDKLELLLVFGNNSVFFKGHFDNYPVLPGVVQLYYVVFSLKKHFDKKITIIGFKKIRFFKIIFPNQKIHLQLIKKNSDTFSFLFRTDENIYSMGGILLGNGSYYRKNPIL